MSHRIGAGEANANCRHFVMFHSLSSKTRYFKQEVQFFRGGAYSHLGTVHDTDLSPGGVYPSSNTGAIFPNQGEF